MRHARILRDSHNAQTRCTEAAHMICRKIKDAGIL
jgi:hypothetical protein